MEIKEIKNIIYTVCAATLTVVASICGIVLTVKTCGVINNCEKITKHAANVGEMIDDKQFVEDVKKDIKNATKGHADAAGYVATVTKSWTEPSKPGEMGYNLNQAASNVATVTKGWTEPSKPGDMGHTTKQILNNLKEASSELNGCAHELNGPSQPGGFGDNLKQASDEVKKAAQRLNNALKRLSGGKIWSELDTRTDAEVEADEAKKAAEKAAAKGENSDNSNPVKKEKSMCGVQ